LSLNLRLRLTAIWPKPSARAGYPRASFIDGSENCACASSSYRWRRVACCRRS